MPSPKYPPPKTGGTYSFSLPEAVNEQLWKENEQEFNARFGATMNEERAKLGLDPVKSVRDTMFTDRPWLAVDPALAPAYPPAGLEILQSGAWILPDQYLLPDDLENFLSSGAAPIYLGFGSLRASEQSGQMVVEAARRIQQLGVGVSGPKRDDLAVDGLVEALCEGLRPEATKRAQALAGRIELRGARIAAERLTSEFGLR